MLGQNGSDLFGKPVRPILPVSPTNTLFQDSISSWCRLVFMDLQILTITLILEVFWIKNPKHGTSKEFPGCWVPTSILGTSGEFPGTFEVCTCREAGMCVALGVCVKAWNFSSSFHMIQLGLTSLMAIHLIDLQFCFSFEPAPIKPKCSTRERLQASYGKRSIYVHQST
jgi:hypothetical protein